MKNCPACHANYPKDYTHCPRDLTALVEIGLWQEGSLVRGRYRILARIGAGGMATVYKAEHVHFHELRALKTINPELAADIKFVQRFTQEAVLTRRLQHPNAVRVDDIDQAEDGLPFIVMEYIQGRSLKDILQSQGPMTTERACSIAKQVASALAAAHEIGIVHRDIKPANVVLVSPSPAPPAAAGARGAEQTRRMELAPPEQVKVLDFGIAKVKEGHLEDARVAQGTLTGTGVLIGTPAYMSPEQAIGKRGDEIDGRSDLYSLGVMMYQMLTGELPLKADSEMGILIAHIQGIPCDLREYRPDVPDVIANLVMQCLAKKPDQRPATGEVFIEEIEKWEGGTFRELIPRRQAEEERVARAPAEAEGASWVQAERESLRSRHAGAERNAPEVAAPAEFSPETDQARIRTASGSLPVGTRRSSSRMGSSSTVPAAKTRRALWAAIAVGIAAVGIGVWLFSANSSGLKTPARNSNSARAAHANTATAAQSEDQPHVAQAVDQGRHGQAPAGHVSSSNSAAFTRHEASLEGAGASKAESQARTAEVQRQVKASTTEGDVDYDDGLYDEAVKAYQTGLKADPENTQLKARIKRALKAKETEGALGSH